MLLILRGRRLILRSINGRPVQRRVDVVRSLSREVIDQRITVVVEREGQPLTLKLQTRARAGG